jgi:protein-disulfide isomerase
MEPEIQSNPSPENQQSRGSNLGIPIAIVIAGLIIAGAVYLRGDTSKNTAGAQAGVAKETSLPAISAKDHILGSPQADLILVEYSDTECPFCKRFQATMHQIMNDYGKDGKVAWVYRHMPLEGLHSRAPREAEATECVAELGGENKFWTYLDSIYDTTNSNDSLDPAELPILAVQAGVDKAAFEKCLGSGKYTAAIKKSIEDGTIAAGTQATPFSVIIDKKGNTYPIEGAYPYATLKPIIEGLLKGK